MRIADWLVSAALLGPACAAAADQTPGIYLYNIQSCGDFLAGQPGAPGRLFAVSFVRGYVSAHNFYNPSRQIRSDLPSNTIEAYVEKYCRENPLNDSGVAAISLVKDLGGVTAPKR